MPPHTTVLPAKTKDDSTLTETARQDTGRMLVLGPAVDISHYVTKMGTHPFADGGSSDMWKGIYKTKTIKETVRIIPRSTTSYLQFVIGCHQVID